MFPKEKGDVVLYLHLTSTNVTPFGSEVCGQVVFDNEQRKRKSLILMNHVHHI